MNSATKSDGATGPTCHSGETSGSSRQRDTTDGQTLSVEAPHVKTSAVPESEPVLPGNALAYSTKCLELLGSFNPDGSFGRTSGLLFPLTEAEIFSQSSTPFTTQGMMRNGVVCVHQISGIRTGGRGFSLWPTAEAHNTRARGAGQTYEKNKAGNACLARDAQNWPTSQSRDWKGPQGRAYKGEAIDLPAAAQNWPTARGRFDSGQHRGSKDSLHSKAKEFHTPRPAPTKPSAGPKSSNAGPGSRRQSHRHRLSKIFVGWLMDFPPDWAATGRRGESLRECIDLLTRSEPRRLRRSETPSWVRAPAGSANES